MSTILKALRRLEREKTRSDQPLREQVTGSNGAYRGDAPPRRWPILLGGIGAGVFAGLAVLVLVFSRGGPAGEVAPTLAAPAAAPAAAAPASPPASDAAAARAARREARVAAAARAAAAPSVPEPAPAPRAIAPLDPDLPGEVAVIDQGAAGPREIAEALPDPGAEPGPVVPGSVRPLQRGAQGLPGRHLLPEGGAGPGAEPPAVAPEAPEEVASAAAPTPEPRPAPVVAPAPPKAAPAPAAPPQPAPTRSAARAPDAAPKPAPAPAFPPLRVERTTWHPQAERRVAIVAVPGAGEQSVHEGDVVAGATVKRIEPSGVLFEHAGRELRRRIGEGVGGS